MPPLNTGINEETEEALEKALYELNYDDKGELVQYCIRYTLDKKFGMDV